MSKTKVQEDFCKNILSGRYKPSNKIKRKKIDPSSFLKKHSITDYMHNCVFWIDKYLEGEEPYSQFKKSIDALKVHIKNLHELSVEKEKG